MGESALHALREEEEVRLFGALGGELRVRREGVDEVPNGVLWLLLDQEDGFCPDHKSQKILV